MCAMCIEWLNLKPTVSESAIS